MSLRRQKEGNPEDLPSGKRNKGHDALARWSVIDVSPDPCTARHQEAAEFSSTWYNEKRSFGHVTRASPVVVPVSLSQADVDSLPASFDWREKAAHCLAFKNVMDQGNLTAE